MGCVAYGIQGRHGGGRPGPAGALRDWKAGPPWPVCSLRCGWRRGRVSPDHYGADNVNKVIVANLSRFKGMGMAFNSYKVVDDHEYYTSVTESDMIIGASVSNDDFLSK